MPKGKKQTAGDAPLPQQRGGRGGLGQASVERLGDTDVGPHGEPKLPHERDQATGEQSTALIAHSAAVADTVALPQGRCSRVMSCWSGDTLGSTFRLSTSTRAG